MDLHTMPAMEANFQDFKTLGQEHHPLNLPITPPHEIEERSLDIILQFSRLEQSIHEACLTDDGGFWNGPREDEALRLELLDISLKLQKMLTRPMDAIQAVAQAHHCEASLRYAVHNSIAQLVPVDGFVSYAAVAAAARVDKVQCRRIMRFLITQSIFAETSTGELCHSPASLQLLDRGVSDWVAYQTTDSMRSSGHLPEALSKWPGSLDKTETAYSLAHNTELSMFDHLAQRGKLERFRSAMSGMAHQPSFSTDHVVSGYPWQNLCVLQDDRAAPVVVDVGGGIGHVASSIHNAYPSLDVRVQDIGVIAPHSKDGIDFSAYDFFQPQPIKGAEVYFIRQIMHDWSDEYAIRILKNQISAMAPHSKLIINDLVLQRPGEWTISEERKSRMVDVTMLTLFNAKERELHEWNDLVARASDWRLQLTSISRPPGSLMSLMEFTFV